MNFCLASAVSFLLLVAPTIVMAQTVSGTVVRDENGVPVAGAIVSAFSGKDTAAVTLSRNDGAFQLAALPRKDLTLLVRAIGLQPVRIPLRSGSDTVVSVRMTRIAFRLATVSVSEFTSCAKTQTGTANIVDVWLEVTKALESTRIARDAKRRRFDYVLYEQLTDAQTGTVKQLKNDTSSWVATRPFKVTPPKELASKGYIVEERESPPFFQGIRMLTPTLIYRAPDEMLLLDESFQTTHCFWASHGDGADQGMIGVHFIPVTGIKINDIRGIFWIDATSYELQRLDYIYTQIKPAPKPVRAPTAGATTEADSAKDEVLPVAPALENPEPGGVLEFQPLSDGTFIIPSWRIFLNDTWTTKFVEGVKQKPPRFLHVTGGLVTKVSGG